MAFWSHSHSLQRKIIMAIVMVGLLPLTFLLALTYVEERRALRETTGANFKEVAVDAARRIEMHITRVMNERRLTLRIGFIVPLPGHARAEDSPFEMNDAQPASCREPGLHSSMRPVAPAVFG